MKIYKIKLYLPFIAGYIVTILLTFFPIHHMFMLTLLYRYIYIYIVDIFSGNTTRVSVKLCSQTKLKRFQDATESVRPRSTVRDNISNAASRQPPPPPPPPSTELLLPLLAGYFRIKKAANESSSLILIVL